MKTYNITNRLSAQAKAELNRIIETHDKYKGAYFWTSDCSADGRRRNEKRFADNNPDVLFIKGEDRIEVKMYYSESCRNVYYSLDVIVNGTKKNIAYIKKCLQNNIYTAIMTAVELVYKFIQKEKHE